MQLTRLEPEIQQQLNMIPHADVTTLCQPLRQHFQLQSMDYFRLYSDGGEINLTTRPEWLSYFFEHKLYQNNAFDLSASHLENGYMLWSDVPEHSNISAIAYERYGMTQGFILVRPNHACGYTDFYLLVPESSNDQFEQSCLSNIDLLDSFVKYFTDQTVEMMATLHRSRIYINDRVSQGVKPEYVPIYRNGIDRQQFISDLSLDGLKVTVGHYSVRLTGREIEVARLLVHGLTMREMAVLMNISSRTIESHIGNLKQKFNVRTKSHLISACLHFIFQTSSHSDICCINP